MQIVYIDLIPQKIKPVVKASQFDDKRHVRFCLTENGEDYTLTGTETVAVTIRKPDRNIVVITPSVTANNYIDVYFTEQACACFGTSFGEIIIEDDNSKIGTCNFDLDVEVSPTFGGIDSATEIDNLETQIEEIVTDVLSDNYYTKTQTDTLLDAKANASDVYTKTQTYTQAEVNALISGIFPTKTATGAIASFTTALSMKLVSCTVEEGATNVTRCGVNLWDEEYFISSSRIQALNFISVKPNTTYNRVTPNNVIPFYYDINKEQIGTGTWGTGPFTTPSNCYYVKFQVDPAYGTTYNNDISINYPSTDTNYHAYNGQTVPVSEATTLVTQPGINNVFADSGEVTVQYKDTTL